MAFMMFILIIALFFKNLNAAFKTIYQKLKYAWLFFVPVFLMFISFYIIGYFKKVIVPENGEYGDYSLNLNCFFNPFGHSFFLKTLPHISERQADAFCYLGLGLIFLFSVSFFIDRSKENKEFISDKKPLFLALAFLILIAISNRVTLGSMSLNIPIDNI